MRGHTRQSRACNASVGPGQRDYKNAELMMRRETGCGSSYTRRHACAARLYIHYSERAITHTMARYTLQGLRRGYACFLECYGVVRCLYACCAIQRSRRYSTGPDRNKEKPCVCPVCRGASVCRFTTRGEYRYALYRIRKSEPRPPAPWISDDCILTQRTKTSHGRR